MEAPDVEVSVVIPCFNSAAYVREALESVLQQTLRAVELVVVDDGSLDGTRTVVEKVVAEHGDRAWRLLHQPNAGVAAARNRGIAAARGRYLLPLDADDRIAPSMLATCAAVLATDRQVDVVFTDREDFGELTGIFQSGRFELDRLKYFNQLPYAALYRREVWTATGGYQINVSGFDDWGFWVAAAARGFRGHHVRAPLFQHRRRRGSQLGQLIGDYERLYAQIILNNRDAYDAAEVAAAVRFLATGKRAALLQAGRAVFERNYPVMAAAPAGE